MFCDRESRKDGGRLILLAAQAARSLEVDGRQLLHGIRVQEGLGEDAPFALGICA